MIVRPSLLLTIYSCFRYTYDHLPEDHKSFVLQVGLVQEPKHFAEAVRVTEWREAMQLELEGLEATNIRTVTPLPSHKHAIRCKWVFKVEYNSDGTVERCKARLVAKGYTCNTMFYKHPQYGRRIQALQT